MFKQLICAIAYFACTLCSAKALFAVALDDDVVSPVTAIASIGKGTVVVEMTVRASKNRLEKRGIFFLDSDADFESPKNLGIAVSENAINQLKKTNGLCRSGEILHWQRNPRYRSPNAI